MPIRINTRLIDSMYVWMISLALCLHVFNTFELFEGFKAFYLPAACAFVISLYKMGRYHRDHLYLVVWAFILVTLVSAFVSRYSGAISTANTMMILVIGAYGLRYVDLKEFLAVNNILILVSIIGLFGGLIFGGIYNNFRFSGYYQDPNYFCTTLLLFIYILLVSIYTTDKKILKIVNLIEIMLTILLVGLSVSRTGLACVGLVLFVGLFALYKRNKFIIVLAIFAAGLAITKIDFSLIFDLFSQRIFQASDGVQSATALRFSLSKRFISEAFSSFDTGILGLGIGSTIAPKELGVIDVSLHHRDHNTITSCLSEHGIIAFIIFCYIHLRLALNLCTTKWLRILRLVTYMSVLMFCGSIWQMTYLPWWMLIFLISNNGGCYDKCISNK